MRVTAEGVEILDQAGYEAAIRAAFLADVNEELGFAASTPQGQFVGISATMFAQGEEGALHAVNGLDRDQAVGYQLDALGGLFVIPRLVAAKSSVTLTFSGAAGAAVSEGDLVEDTDGNRWELDSAGEIAVGDNSMDVDASSQSYGAVEAVAGSITKLVTVRPEIESVTNAAAAAPGRLSENDPAYRLRQDDLVGKNSSGSVPAIRAALAEYVTHSRVERNDEDADEVVQGATIPAHGIRVIVHGGTDAEVSAAIKEAKSVGVATAGSTDEDGYRFDRADTIALALSITVAKSSGYPPAGDEQIKAALASYASVWGIGEKPDIIRLLASAVLAVLGFEITAHALTLQLGGGALPATPALATLYTLAAADITIAV